MKGKLKLIITILVVLLGCVAIILGQLQVSKLDSQIGPLTKSIENSKDALKKLKDVTVDTKKAVETKLASCSALGTSVADLQNRYSSLAGPSFTPSALKEISDKLDRYFSDDSKNFRTPWFMPLGEDNSLMVQGSWSFKTNYSFSGNTVDVLWVFTTTDKKDLVFVTGKYNAESDNFFGLQRYYTGEAYKSLATNNSSEIKPLSPEQVKKQKEEFLKSIDALTKKLEKAQKEEDAKAKQNNPTGKTLDSGANKKDGASGTLIEAKPTNNQDKAGGN